MNDHQVSLLAAAISTAGPIFAVLIGILLNNRQLDKLEGSLRAEITSLRTEMTGEISSLRREMVARFESAHQGLLRVEGIVDARLKHLEERAK